MSKKLYLAYGSNLSISQMNFRCPDAFVVGRATIKDYRLMYKGSKTGAYATIEPAEGYEVPVLVWMISENDEKSLDRYEGYPVFYYKKELEVEVMGISRRDRDKSYGVKTAMVYIMDEERGHGLPSRYYEEILKEGYKQFGFDNEILKEARRFTAQQMLRQKTVI